MARVDQRTLDTFAYSNSTKPQKDRIEFMQSKGWKIYSAKTRPMNGCTPCVVCLSISDTQHSRSVGVMPDGSVRNGVGSGKISWNWNECEKMCKDAEA